ncbi:MAG: Glycosyl transferase, family 4 [archaeon GW2011_AR17]|nr:MAG: Glycosyl transferase, family 4 [archaeon GW2011_AR17]MBS3153900.1 hypothetical protein [Candidatus Woesearchaeota archaeon]HIH15501.1 hypothetical protein [Nanoarchaeota archaeon]HIH59304.1 hypothetical protein [Nanoarchaeota archaeon]HII13901.1 hypothetical protein [Nanoarchaeota archaeon]
MKYVLLFSLFISFFIVWFLTPWFIRYLTRIGLLVKDQHKDGKPLIPISGGLPVLAGVFFGVMFAIFIQTFYYHSTDRLIDLLAFTSSLFAITLVGFFDDLLIRKDKEESSGLKQWQKPLLTAIAAVPLMVINAGETVLAVPFFGSLDVGLLYPLVLIPLGVIGASNMVNMLAGYNGLEAGLGIIYLGNLSVYAYMHGSEVAALIGAISCAALFAFLLFNWVPAKIFPGDSLTYLLGAVLASMAIIGNIEMAALLVSFPFFIEGVLKLRGRLKKQSYGMYYKDGKIKSLYEKVYSIPHFFTIDGKFTEKQVVVFVYFIGLLFSGLIWLL